VTYPLYSAVRQATNNYNMDIMDPDVSCKVDINLPMADIVSVKAGTTIYLQWHHEPNGGQAGDSEEPVAPTYVGPVLHYMAAVSNATTAVSANASWFKVQEEGYHTSNKTWGLDTFRALKGLYPVPIPCDLADGDYLIRGEFFSFHLGPAYDEDYPGCVQVHVTGGTGTAKPSTVKFPGAYQSTDPGINTSVYYPEPTAYLPPGPRPYVPTCGGGGGGTTSAPTTTTTAKPTTTTTAKPTTTTAPTTTTSKPSTTTSAPSVQQTQYGQCGGIGWTGPTTCVSPFICTVGNAYYSQCL